LQLSVPELEEIFARNLRALKTPEPDVLRGA
jgi:hypothetical protein